MKFTISTPVLKDALRQVMKTVNPSKVLPVSRCIKFEAMDGYLGIQTTTFDSITSLVITEVDIDKMGICYIPAGELNKLVNKTTKMEIVISANENSIEFKGNGKYTFEVEEGEFPTIKFSEGVVEVQTNLGEFQKDLKIASSSTADEDEFRVLSGIMVDNGSIVSTNNTKAIVRHTHISVPIPMLFPPALINFVVNVLVDKDKIVELEYNEEDGLIRVRQGDICMIAYELADKEQFPDITGLLENLEEGEKVSVDTKELLNVLDRMSIFSNIFDNNAISIEVYGGEIIFSNGKKAKEKLEIENGHLYDASFSINAKFIQDIVKSLSAYEDRVLFDISNSNMLIIDSLRGCAIIAHLVDEVD